MTCDFYGIDTLLKAFLPLSNIVMKLWICYKHYIFTVFALYFVYLFIQWERWTATKWVGYLNDPCELSEEKLDQLRTGIVFIINW